MGLIEKMAQPAAVRAQVLDDCVQLLESEVASKSGLSGIAIKGAYAVFRRFKPDITRRALDHFLEPFLLALEPMYADFQRSGSKDLSAFVKVHAGEAAEALLQVTDARAAAAEGAVAPLKAAYGKLRPMAAKHVEQAVPRFAAVLGRYA